MINHIEPADLKVGLLVWWEMETDNSYEFGTPGIITNVNLEENTFRVFTFDDLDETTDLPIHKENCGCGSAPPIVEMRLSNTEEVANYILEQRQHIVTKILNLQGKYNGLSEIHKKLIDNDILGIITKNNTNES